MKSMALIITVLTLSAPLAANASVWTVSEELASNSSLTAPVKDGSVRICKASTTNVPDPDPYVVRG